MQIEKYIDLEETNKSDEISDDVYQMAVELEFAVLPIVRPLSTSADVFNEMECNRLTELFNAMSIWKTPSNVEVSELTDHNVVCNNIGLKLENDIKSMVTVSKGLTSFNTLCESDQISLLKHSSIDVFTLRSVVNFNFETQYWTFTLVSASLTLTIILI